MQHNGLDNEKGLIRQLAKGDEMAFRRVFYHYGAIIHPVVLKIVKDVPVAEDIIADLFIKVWLNRHNLSTMDNPSGWIYRVATHLSINHIRRSKLQKTALQQLLPDFTGQENHTYERLSAKELERLVQQAVNTLPPQRRRIFELSRVHGLDRQAIAQQLQISENTVKNQLRLALHHVQQFILKAHGVLLPVLLLTEKIFF